MMRPEANRLRVDRLAHQPGQIVIVFVGKGLVMAENLGVADPQEESEIERVIVAAIEKHARGDVEALACGIIEIAPTTGPTAGMRCRRDQ
jgi:hypothetical protein